jgi:hypothetical protein
MKSLELLSNSVNAQAYSEIQQEIDYLVQRFVLLQAKINERMQSELSNEKQEEVLLSFEDASRMIFWSNGSIHLPPKQYLLVKTIWNANDRTTTLDVIEENIWNIKDDDDKENAMFISHSTICELVHRTRNSMNRANFPYEIMSVFVKQTVEQNSKPNSRKELQGYRLIVKKRENFL